MEKKKPCTDCKKKAKVLPVEIPKEYFPTEEEIMETYEIMSSAKIKPEQFPIITKVYKAIFNEDLPVGCNQCGEVHYRKLTYYIKNTLKKEI